MPNLSDNELYHRELTYTRLKALADQLNHTLTPIKPTDYCSCPLMTFLPRSEYRKLIRIEASFNSIYYWDYNTDSIKEASVDNAGEAHEAWWNSKNLDEKLDVNSWINRKLIALSKQQKESTDA